MIRLRSFGGIIIGAILALTVMSAATPAQASPSLYVALGDSFSAGPGSGIVPGQPLEDQSVYEAGTLGKCERSSVAYPMLLANAKSMALRNVACGGATVNSVLNTGQFGEPAQIDAVTSDATLVTLTLGGNDIGFTDIVSCVVQSECTNTSSAIQSANTSLMTLQTKLQTVLSAAHTKAPTAKIVVGGYPKVLPSAGQAAWGCIGWLSNAEQAIVNTLQVSLNAAIQAAVSNVSNVVYLDAFASDSPFMTRDLLGLTSDACSLSTSRKINGIRLDFPNGSFHPNGLGQQAYFQMYNAAA